MRVIAGEFRGRTLVAPAGRGTRPITDRGKAALFDWLGARLAMPGWLPPLHVLDLFCGAGSLGLEALSRGAASCVFVETDAAALECLRSNLARLGATGRARVVGAPVASAPIGPPADGAFGLIFVDPPYRLSEAVVAGAPMYRVCERLGRDVAVTAAALLAWRHDRATTLPAAVPGGWASLERRTWGSMAVTLFARADQVPP